jgi:hypothetical protein
VKSALGGSLESGGDGAFVSNVASVAMKMFSRLIFLLKKFYKCTFNAICKDNSS